MKIIVYDQKDMTVAFLDCRCLCQYELLLQLYFTGFNIHTTDELKKSDRLSTSVLKWRLKVRISLNGWQNV